MERYKKLMGIKKGKAMIELPKIYYNRVCRVEDVEAYGKACAAEAREQMREECEIAINPHASYLGDEVIDIIKELK